MADDTDMSGTGNNTTADIDFNHPMTFATAVEPGFTKTPANVKNNYVPGISNHGSKMAPPTKKIKAITAPPSQALQAKLPVRKRATGKKTAASRPISRSFEECDEADQMLITLRDQGNDWPPIRKRWKEMTGETTATSTLPNRYARLKMNFTVINEEDNPLLLSAKREVEESFEAQKWDLVARVMSEKGGGTYAGVVLKRQYKKLMVTQAMCEPPPGVKDPDFEVDEGDIGGEAEHNET